MRTTQWDFLFLTTTDCSGHVFTGTNTRDQDVKAAMTMHIQQSCTAREHSKSLEVDLCRAAMQMTSPMPIGGMTTKAMLKAERKVPAQRSSSRQLKSDPTSPPLQGTVTQNRWACRSECCFSDNLAAQNELTKLGNPPTCNTEAKCN